MADSNLNDDDLDALFAGDDDAAPAPLSPVPVQAKEAESEDAAGDSDEDFGDVSDESEADASEKAEAEAGDDSDAEAASEAEVDPGANDEDSSAAEDSDDDESDGADESDDGVVSFDQLIRTAKKSGPKPAAAPKPEFDSEGEDSGLADIMSVAKAMKSKREDAVEASEDEPAKSSVDDDDDLLADRGAGFGAAAAVAVVEVAPEAAPAKTEEKTKVAAAPAAAPAEGGGGKFAIAAVLIAAIGGVGYMTMGGQDKATKGPGAAEAARPQVAAIEPKGASDDKDDKDDKEPEEPAKLEPNADDSAEAEPSDGEGELLAMADDAGETEGEPALGDSSGDPKKAGSHGKKSKKSKKGGGAAKSDPDGKAEKVGGDAGTEEPPEEGAEDKADEKADGGAEEKPEEGAEEKPAEKAGGGGSEVDCLLNPDKPGCGGQKKVEKKADTGPALPEKLSQTDLRAGFQAVKAQAKECGAKNKIPPGTKIKIKVSIEGASGKVVKASALGDYANTSVGRCIEANVKTASFGKFSSGQMGITWPFKL